MYKWGRFSYLTKKDLNIPCINLVGLNTAVSAQYGQNSLNTDKSGTQYGQREIWSYSRCWKLNMDNFRTQYGHFRGIWINRVSNSINGGILNLLTDRLLNVVISMLYLRVCMFVCVCVCVWVSVCVDVYVCVCA